MLLRSDKLSSRSTTLKRFIIIVLIIGLQLVQQTNARRITLMPLTAADVYRLLHETYNSDAVPEGRVVTQGVAAAAGFTLGLKKALAGVFLYEVVTANITEATAASQKLYLTREVCFGTRIARSFEEAEAIAESYSRLEEKTNVLKPEVRKSAQKRRSKPKRNRKGLIKNRGKLRIPQRLDDDKANVQALASQETNASKKDSIIPTAPFTTQVGESEAAAADVKLNGAAILETVLSTTTSTDNDEPLTCIVTQAPKE